MKNGLNTICATLGRSRFHSLGNLVSHGHRFCGCGIRYFLASLCLTASASGVEFKFSTAWTTRSNVYIYRGALVHFPASALFIYNEDPVGSGSWYGQSMNGGSAYVGGDGLCYTGSYASLNTTTYKACVITPARVQVRFAFALGASATKYTFDLAPFGGVSASAINSSAASAQNITLYLDDLQIWGNPTDGFLKIDPYDPSNVDTDHDGTPDTNDTDDDNDGIPDVNDAHPLVPHPANDTDDDGQANDDDPDDDNDGTPDGQDPDHPSYDFDHDGIPDVTDGDDDNDGIPDGNDPHPRSYYDSENPQNKDKPIVPGKDTDNDGTPDDQDPAPTDPNNPKPPPTPPTPPPAIPGQPGGGTGSDPPPSGEPANNNAAMNAIEGSDGGLGGKSTGAPARDVGGAIEIIKGGVGEKLGGLRPFAPGSIPRASTYTLALNLGPKFGVHNVVMDFNQPPFTIIRPIMVAMLAMGFFFAFLKFAKI